VSVLILAAVILCALMFVAPASGQIVYDGGGDSIWVMNDDGTGQRPLVTLGQVPGMGKVSQPHVDPSGTTVVFAAEWANASAEGGRWSPPAPFACGFNCTGIYKWSAGAVSRLSPGPSGCPLNPCASSESEPEIASDGQVVFEYVFVNYRARGCGGWCSTDSDGQIKLRSDSSSSSTVPTPCSGSGTTFPEHPTPNPAGAEIAYAGCLSSPGQWGIFISNRDGSSLRTLAVDDAPIGDPSWSPDGTRIVDAEDNGQSSPTQPGIWTYNTSGTVQPVWALSTGGVTVTSPRYISGNRFAFAAQGSVWTIPTSCGGGTNTSPCSFPADATRLTAPASTSALGWTGQTLPTATLGPGSGGAGPGSRKAPCSRLKGSARSRCEAKERFNKAAANCAKIKARTKKGKKKKAACLKKAKLAYKRELAVIACRSINKKAPRNACIKKARKLKN
jgi:hypothetical protein